MTRLSDGELFHHCAESPDGLREIGDDTLNKRVDRLQQMKLEELTRAASRTTPPSLTRRQAE